MDICMGKKEELVKKLRSSGRKDYIRLADSIENDLDYYHDMRTSDLPKGKTELAIKKGNANQHLDEIVDTSYDAYYSKHIQPNLKDEKGNGNIDYRDRQGFDPSKNFDDRKYRLSSVEIDGPKPIIGLGPTHFGQFHRDRKIPLEKRLELMEKGLDEHGDPWIYFARPCGVAVVHVSSEGNVWIGERTRGDDEGPLNAVAGQIDYYGIEGFNPYKNGDNESFEEYGISLDIKNTPHQFVGISSNPTLGDCDFVFVVYSGKPDSYYESGEWANNVKAQGRNPEHKQPLYKISSKKECIDLLEKGIVQGAKRPFAVMYSTRLGLEWLSENH